MANTNIGLIIPGVNSLLKNSNGGGIKGFMPPSISDVDKDYINFEQVRFTLTQSWNTTYPSQLKKSNKTRIITPFRAVNNSGDILSRKAYSCGGSCLTPQSIPNLHGLSQRFGGVQNQCDGTFVPPATCNVKYVYDSSDYTTYLKQRSTSRNYNDLSYGGDNSSGSQSAFRAIRRY